ncbi:MAG TPA: L,D-transpeptidase family protein [Anaerolineales bacterium]|nr:L,D-transpeptidase family protein [Anaerolineales bacterium]
MNRNLSRRDFLKIAGAGLGALAFNPLKLKEFPLVLPQFPVGERLGRVFSMIDVRSEPSINAPSVNVLYDDAVVVWEQEVVTSGAKDPNLINQRWVKTPDGFIYADNVQPVKNLPNTPLTAIPDGKPGFWAEVTLPYADMVLDGPAISPHIRFLVENNQPIRLYYSQAVWIDQIAQGDGGAILYRFNENGGRPAGLTGGGYGDMLWGEGSAFRPLTPEDLEYIHPDVDPALKKVVVDRTENYQTLSCYEGNEEVYFCRVSTGQYRDVYGNPVTEYLTPLGEHTTWRKAISIHMSGGTTGTGYDTPAVSWTTLFSGDGYAIHAAFWHNKFGVPRSHGCVNCRPEDAKWIFRWTTPLTSLEQGDIAIEGLTNGTHVIVQELSV